MDKRISDYGAAAQAASVPANRDEMIAVAAYFRAERRGFAPGDPKADWLAAEAEIDRLLGMEGGGSDAAATAKQKFQQQLAAQLKDWDAMVDDCMAMAAQAKTKTRSEIQKQLDAFAVQRTAAEQKLAELRAQSGDAWEDMKDGAEKAWQEMRNTVDRIAARFK